MNTGIQNSDQPTFVKRPEKERYQVRFWSEPVAYAAFVREVQENGLVIQDVFNNFMEWFTFQSKGEGIVTIDERFLRRSDGYAKERCDPTVFPGRVTSEAPRPSEGQTPGALRPEESPTNASEGSKEEA